MSVQLNSKITVSVMKLFQIADRRSISGNQLAEVLKITPGRVSQLKRDGELTKVMPDVFIELTKLLSCRASDIAPNMPFAEEFQVHLLELAGNLQKISGNVYQQEIAKNLLGMTSNRIAKLVTSQQVLGLNDPTDFIEIACKLYSESGAIVSTSIDKVSRHWREHNFERYLEHQKGKKVTRYFVFSSTDSLMQYIEDGTLDAHHKSYGSSGGVYLMNIVDYIKFCQSLHLPTELVCEFVDFAVIRSRDWKHKQLLTLEYAPDSFPAVSVRDFASLSPEKRASMDKFVELYGDPPSNIEPYELVNTMGLKFVKWYPTKQQSKIQKIVEMLGLSKLKRPEDVIAEQVDASTAQIIKAVIEYFDRIRKEDQAEDDGSWWPGGPRRK